MRKFIILTIAACAILACNDAADKGVMTKNGFRLVNHTNKGGQKPKPGDWVLMQTYAHIKDSLMLDSQRDFGGPQESELVDEAAFLGRVPSIYDALMLMGVGDSATVYEPLDSNAMNYVPASLKDATEVRYTIVLMKITSKAEKEKEQAAAAAVVPQIIQDYNAGKLTSNMKITRSGLKILVEEAGTGAQVKAGEKVEVQYRGYLRSGFEFDNSYKRRQPLSFVTAAGQMIPGFDEGVQQLKHGAKAYLFIPPHIGYGAQEKPPIPPNSELIFYIELL